MKALILALLLAAHPALASDLPTKPFSLHAKKMGTRDLLVKMFKQAKLKFAIDPQITNDKKISLDVKNAAWDTTFHDLIASEKLSYFYGDDKVVRVTAPK